MKLVDIFDSWVEKQQIPQRQALTLLLNLNEHTPNASLGGILSDYRDRTGRLELRSPEDYSAYCSRVIEVLPSHFKRQATRSRANLDSELF